MHVSRPHVCHVVLKWFYITVLCSDRLSFLAQVVVFFQTAHFLITTCTLQLTKIDYPHITNFFFFFFLEYHTQSALGFSSGQTACLKVVLMLRQYQNNLKQHHQSRPSRSFVLCRAQIKSPPYELSGIQTYAVGSYVENRAEFFFFFFFKLYAGLNIKPSLKLLLWL